MNGWIFVWNLGKNWSFSFHSIPETLEEAKGVFREFWNKPLNTKHTFALRDNPYFLSPSSSSSVLQDFDAPVRFSERYAQRLSAYLQVSSCTNTHAHTHARAFWVGYRTPVNIKSISRIHIHRLMFFTLYGREFSLNKPPVESMRDSTGLFYANHSLVAYIIFLVVQRNSFVNIMSITYCVCLSSSTWKGSTKKCTFNREIHSTFWNYSTYTLICIFT